MNKFLAVLGTIAVFAGPAAAVAETINPKYGAAIAAAGGVALAVTKPILDVQAKLDARKEKKVRRAAALR